MDWSESVCCPLRNRFYLLRWRVSLLLVLMLTRCRGTSYGLLLDSTFSRNSSATSPAFQNEILCGAGFSDKGEPFDCIGLEVWATS